VNNVLVEKLSGGPRCGKCKSVVTFPRRPVDATSQTFNDEVKSPPGAVLVMFWSPTCGHCMRLRPVMEEIAAEMSGLVKIVMVNTASEMMLARAFDIRGVPALHLYRGGVKIGEIAGAAPKEQIVQWVRSAIAA
jgi:thioredoxin-like negative regulator of GroEL